MKRDSAPRPNGFELSFFEYFWELVKENLMNIFKDFQGGFLDMKQLNYGVITLVSKVKEANMIK